MDISDPNIEICVPVGSDIEIVSARRQGRSLAEQIGFTASEATLVATAISELARNIVHYAGGGEVLLGKVKTSDNKFGIAIIARDEGPGIPDLELAMRNGYSTSGGLGLGLPGVKHIMDEFDINSLLGYGTTVTTIKWKQS